MSPLSHGEMVQMARMHGNSCVICGEEIPEGRMVCPICEKQELKSNLSHGKNQMNDLISRKTAIDAIRASAKKYTGFMGMEIYTDDDAVEAINGVPSAQSERKKGKWTHIGGDEWVCDKCGFVLTTAGSWEHPFDAGNYYCKHCGADMRDEDDDIPMEYFENGGK